MGDILFELTIIIGLASFLAIIFRFFRQPTILAYIVTGIILGPFGNLQLHNFEDLRTLGEIGVTLLLFMLGLELKLRELKSIGIVALLIGGGQILLTGLGGFLLSLLFGVTVTTSLYIGVAVAFSSTIIIVTLLSNKKDLNSLYGKLTVGILLLQDFFAIFVLIILSSFNSSIVSQTFLFDLSFALVKGILLFLVVIGLSKTLFPALLHFLARSQEILFLFSIAWVFSFSAFISSSLIGFPIEIGGFLAGLALANAAENMQIAARIRGLRDFFITIFFVTLGIGMTFGSIQTILPIIILLTLFIIVGKPLIVMSIMGILGYRKRTSFFTAFSLGQISEFSLIIMYLGNKLGHVSSEVTSAIAVVGILSFGISAYVMSNQQIIYKFLSKYLSIFERYDAKEASHGIVGSPLEAIEDHITLIGGNRMGESILNELEEHGDIVVIDFDPDIIKKLRSRNIASFFGDITDIEIQEKARLHNAKLVISTVPDVEDNILLLHTLSKRSKDVKVIVLAQDIEEAKLLYKKGANYVIVPHVLGGVHIANIIKNDIAKLDTLRERHLKELL